eukprot:365515-Chlamydomonas_euryale.AAC.6
MALASACLPYGTRPHSHQHQYFAPDNATRLLCCPRFPLPPQRVTLALPQLPPHPAKRDLPSSRSPHHHHHHLQVWLLPCSPPPPPPPSVTLAFPLPPAKRDLPPIDV